MEEFEQQEGNRILPKLKNNLSNLKFLKEGISIIVILILIFGIILFVKFKIGNNSDVSPLKEGDIPEPTDIPSLEESEINIPEPIEVPQL